MNKPQPRPTVLSEPPTSAPGNDSAADMLAQEVKARSQNPITIDKPAQSNGAPVRPPVGVNAPIRPPLAQPPAPPSYPYAPIPYSPIEPGYQPFESTTRGVNAPIRPPLGSKTAPQAPPAPQENPFQPTSNGVSKPSGAVEGTPTAQTKEYLNMLKDWNVDPGDFPGATRGAPFKPRIGGQVAPKVLRKFPVDQLSKLADQEGITSIEAARKLRASGWLIMEQPPAGR